MSKLLPLRVTAIAIGLLLAHAPVRRCQLVPFSAAATTARTPASEPAYVTRGHQVEAHQHELKDRLDSFHAALSKLLRLHAPDLLAKIEPPPPIIYGYQILPRFIPDNPPAPAPKPQVKSFSWRWSDALIGNEMTGLDALEANLNAVTAKPGAERRAAYESLVESYQKALDHRRTIDADIDYNWLWQRQIANGRPLFDRLTAHLNSVAAQLSASPSAVQSAGSPDLSFDPPAYVHVYPPIGGIHNISVPFYTDILDSEVVEKFQHAIESYWRVYDGKDEYRVRLDITVIAPESLYCPDKNGMDAKDGGAKAANKGNDAGKNAAAQTCSVPPARGTHLDLDSHVARFPADAAVLTTGAQSLQVTANRAIVLGSHDVAPRTLAHEFGHILGFPDAYLRGYKDLGADGFEILELVPDYADIMSSPGFGSVLPAHFKALIGARQDQRLMQAGLDALYTQHDPSKAAELFRQVLAINPNHYGATLQLAKALDQAGRPAEALPFWRKMLTMAQAANDAETLKTVRTRLASAPPG